LRASRGQGPTDDPATISHRACNGCNPDRTVVHSRPGVLGRRALYPILGDRTLNVLDRSSTDQAALIEGMAEILGQAIDLATVARLALGRNWPRASRTQQQEYISLFRAHTLGTLAQRFSQYVGTERFVVTGSRPAGNDDAMVSTRIVYTDYPPLSIDWRVRDGEGNPTIVDVVVEGVSLILTTRAEFDSIVGRRGLEGLLEDMRVQVGRVGPGKSGAGGQSGPPSSPTG
jgi:phospholipid transport system substrate-binding protein